MTSTQEPARTDPDGRASGGITTFTATAIAVADMVGIGVFTSLGFQVLGIDSGFSLIMLWVVGGIVALCGALSYAELAAALPRSGGEYNFLSRVYHPAVGFMAGWLSATVGFSAPIALASMAFAAYFTGIFPDFGAYFAGIFPGVSPKMALGLALAWTITAIHLTGARHTSAFQNVSTVFKVVLIVGFVVAGFAFAEPQPISFMPSAVDWTHISGASFAVSLVFVMYAYSGWNASVYIIGEIRDPQATVPRALFAATLIVLVLYVALNAVFLYSTPIEAMKGQVDVALVVGKHIFGEQGGRIVGGLICIGLISAVSAMIWLGPRVTRVMGEDLPLLSHFSKLNARGVPAAAILLQAALVTVMILTDSFESVLKFIQFSITLSSFAAVLGVLVLRWRQPDLVRPYLTWGYPVTPLIFLAVTGYMLYFVLRSDPIESLAGLALLSCGLIVYFISIQLRQSSAAPGE